MGVVSLGESPLLAVCLSCQHDGTSRAHVQTIANLCGLLWRVFDFRPGKGRLRQGSQSHTPISRRPEVCCVAVPLQRSLLHKPHAPTLNGLWVLPSVPGSAPSVSAASHW